MFRATRDAGSLLLLGLSVIAGAYGSADSRVQMSEKEFGENWSFTVDQITLRCEDPQRRHVVFDVVQTLHNQGKK